MAVVTEEDVKNAWQAGRDQGVVNARLDSHDAKLATINGNINRFATVVEGLTTAVNASVSDAKAAADVAKALREADALRSQELRDADEIRRKHTAEEEEIKRKTLEEVNAERRRKSDVNWIPWARGFVVLTILIQLLNMYYNSKGQMP